MDGMKAWFESKGEAVWRASRTARQVMWGVVGAALAAALAEYSQTQVFPWDFVWYQGVVVGIATVVAYYQNRPSDDE